MLCATFKELAERTWDRMALNGTTGVLLREDGITALNLQDLISRHRNELTIVDFSPIVEARDTGADWEWWFVDDDGAIGFAVQAKRLNNGHYDVGYKPRNYAYQINTLLKYSAANHLSPLYCWYNYFDSAHARGGRTEWGCAIADAYGVYQYHRRKQYALADLEPISTPWHTLACIFDRLGVAGVYTETAQNSSHLKGPRKEKPYVLPGRIERVEPKITRGLPERVKYLLGLGEAISSGDAPNIPAKDLPRHLMVVRRRRGRHKA